MKLTTTPAPTLAALRQQKYVHDAGAETLKLQRTREIYAALYQRFQDVLRLDDEGYEVTITVRGLSRTLTLSAAETEACFNLDEMYAVLGNRLNAHHAEILDMLLKVEGGTPLDSQEGTDEPLLHQALALCLPAPTPATEVPAVPTTSATRAA